MKKYRHNKLIAGLTMGLVAVSVATVGFSAWVIGEQRTTDTGDISVTVAPIKDNTVEFVLGGTQGVLEDKSIKFDAAAKDTTGKIQWNGTDSEDLTFEIEFTAKAKNETAFKGVSVAAVETGTTLKGFVDSGYIIAPFKFDDTTASSYVGLIDGDLKSGTSIVYYDNLGNATTTASPESHYAKANITVTPSGNDYKYTVKYTFAWGETFNYQNPSIYGDDTNYETAKAGIDALIAGGTPTFKLSLKHDPATKVEIA